MYSTAVYRSVTHVCFRFLHLDSVALARRPNAIVSSRRNRRSSYYHKVPINPGINNSLEMFGFKSNDDIPEDLLNDLDNLETDFMNVHKVHKVHESEVLEYKEMVHKKMIERKYFKEPRQPKLLTWEEHEQIHYLHKSNSEEWTPKKISECFPVTEEIAVKILKSKWTPKSVDNILKYNEGVAKNWKLLSEGNLDVSEELRQHLSQFTSREKMLLKPPDPGVLPPAVKQQETISHEFSDIIDSYKNKSSKSNSKKSKPFSDSSHRTRGDEDTYVLTDHERRNSRRVTLDKYSEDILKYRKKFDALDKAIVDNFEKKIINSDQPETSYVQVNKFETGCVEKKSIDVKPVPLPPEKIQIPARLKGKGSLYKVDDCYYDTDGVFLYRVPGMT